MKMLILLFALVLTVPRILKAGTFEALALEGVVTNSAGDPQDLNGKTVEFSIIANNCVLYKESSNTSGDSSGNLFHRVGLGSQSYIAHGTTLNKDLFNKDLTGQGGCTAVKNDKRFVRVHIPHISFTGDLTLDTVAYSFVAQEAESINGKTEDDFINASTDVTQTKAETLFEANTWSKLTGLLSKYDGVNYTGGVSGNAATATTALTANSALNVSGIIAVSNGGTGASTLSANGVLLGNGTDPLQSVAPGATGNVLTSNGTSWISAASSGLVASVAGRTGTVTLTHTDISGLGSAATKNVGTDPGNLIEIQTAGKLPALDGSQLTNLPPVKLQDLRNSTGAMSAFSVAGCTPAQTLVWSSIIDQFACQDITGVPATSITGLAAVATSGDYNSLINQPVIPPAQVNADWSAASGITQILNKPALSVVATSGNYNDLSGLPTLGLLAGKNSVDLSGADATGTIADARMPALSGAVTTTAGSTVTHLSNNVISNVNVMAGAAIEWGKIDKTGAAPSHVGIPNGSSDGQLLRWDAGNSKWIAHSRYLSSCKTGFTGIGNSGTPGFFCIKNDEDDLANWFQAVKACTTAGYELCSVVQYALACDHDSASFNYTNIFLSSGTHSSSSIATWGGTGSCSGFGSQVPSSGGKYRCCYK